MNAMTRIAETDDAPIETSPQMLRIAERAYERELERKHAIDGSLGVPAAIIPFLLTSYGAATFAMMGGLTDPHAAARALLLSLLLAGVVTALAAGFFFLRVIYAYKYMYIPRSGELLDYYALLRDWAEETGGDADASFRDVYVSMLIRAAAHHAERNAKKSDDRQLGYTWMAYAVCVLVLYAAAIIALSIGTS